MDSTRDDRLLQKKPQKTTTPRAGIFPATETDTSFISTVPLSVLPQSKVKQAADNPPHQNAKTEADDKT
jgi:hypothetical protein